MITVVMAVNNEQGINSGEIDRIDFEIEHEIVLSLEWTSCQRCRYKRYPAQRKIVIAFEMYKYVRYGEWSGSMIFDCAELTEATAERLVKELWVMGEWSIVEAHEDFYNEWQAGEVRFSDIDVLDYAAQEAAGQKRLPGFMDS